jgi:hypothetical protein
MDQSQDLLDLYQILQLCKYSMKYFCTGLARSFENFKFLLHNSQLEQNQFSGPVPDSIGNLRNLMEL